MALAVYPCESILCLSPAERETCFVTSWRPISKVLEWPAPYMHAETHHAILELSFYPSTKIVHPTSLLVPV